MRIRALSRLHVDPALRPGYVVTTAPQVVDLEDGRWLMIPSGFWSDGASIPRIARPLFDPLTLLATGIAHDAASRRGAVIHPPPGSADEPDEPVTLRLATCLADAIARRAGIGPVRRAMIRAALTVAAPTYFGRRAMDWRPA